MVTYLIIALNCIVSIYGFSNRSFFSKYLFNPYSIQRNKKEWCHIFTHAFLHADYMHLLFNMFTFYSIGLPLEQEVFPAYFGNHAEYYFVLLYVGGIMASAFPAFEKNKNNFGYTSVGASGAVCAVIFSYILILPTSGMMMLFLPFSIPAALFGGLFLLVSWYLSKRGGGRVAHDAHFWGGVFGFVFTILLKFSLLPAFFEQIKSLF